MENGGSGAGKWMAGGTRWSVVVEGDSGSGEWCRVVAGGGVAENWRRRNWRGSEELIVELEWKGSGG